MIKFKFVFLKSGSNTRTEGNIAVPASHLEDTRMKIYSRQPEIETRDTSRHSNGFTRRSVELVFHFLKGL